MDNEAFHTPPHNTAEPRPTDPDWVHRKDPETALAPGKNASPKLGTGTGYDPASATVGMMEGEGTHQSTGGSSSQTGILPRAYDQRTGDPQALGNVGADVHTDPHTDAAGLRRRAGTDKGVKGKELQAGFDTEYSKRMTE